MHRRLALAASSLWPLGLRAQGSVTPDDKGGAPPAAGSVLALPELTLFDGTRFGPAAADGKVVVLYWWASWCPFCAMQSPHMEQLWRAQRSRGLVVLGLSVDKKEDDARGYHAKRGYTFPSGMVTTSVAVALPKPRGLPVTVVRGRDGRVRWAEAGQLFPEDIEAIARFV